MAKGFDSEADYNKAKGVSKEKKSGKVFKIKECPKCGSDEVGLVLSNSDAEEGGGKEWECRKCEWVGSNIVEKELTEDEFMAYLDEKGEEVA
jgi:DNA-directed RNA polymerase subunit M/transcription elongation factor TFIIS